MALCTVPPDSVVCLPFKTAGQLPPLEGVYLTGHNDSLSMTWATDVSYAGQTVTVLLRPQSGGPLSRRIVSARNAPPITMPDLDVSKTYVIYYRVEDATTYGVWNTVLGYTEDGWSSSSELISFDNQQVIHEGHVVVFTAP